MQKFTKKIAERLLLTKQHQPKLLLKQTLKLKPSLPMATTFALHTVTKKLPNGNLLVTPACYSELVNH